MSRDAAVHGKPQDMKDIFDSTVLIVFYYHINAAIINHEEIANYISTKPKLKDKIIIGDKISY